MHLLVICRSTPGACRPLYYHTAIQVSRECHTCYNIYVPLVRGPDGVLHHHHGRAPGRPYLVAVVPFSNSEKVQLLDDFYTAVGAFKYAECSALARALNVSIRAVYRWKYRERFPRWDVAIDVIQWVRAGKPVRKVYQSKAPRSKVM